MDNAMLIDAWNDITARVKTFEEVDPPQVDAFFTRLNIQAMSDGFLMLTADGEFIKDWVERHYLEHIKRALREMKGCDYTVLLEVYPSGGAVQQTSQPDISPAANTFSQPNPQTAAGGLTTNTVGTDNNGGIYQPSSTDAKEHSPYRTVESGYVGSSKTLDAPATSSPGYSNDASLSGPSFADTTAYSSQGTAGVGQDRFSSESIPEGSPHIPNMDTDEPDFPSRVNSAQDAVLDGPLAQYTFESFVIGESNEFAYSMARSVAEDPTENNPLNPLFIYGESGLGKTHLMRAIQNYIIKTQPHLRCVYVDAQEFLSDFTEASAAHDLEKLSYKHFKQRYEEADVLLIDDVQYLEGKKQTLDMVFQIFKKLSDRGKQIVLAADRSPKNIDIDRRYQSRFEGGMITEINRPDTMTKKSIVQSCINQFRSYLNREDLVISDEIQYYIAEVSGSNIRELKGAVSQVVYRAAHMNSSEMTVDDVRVLLQDVFNSGPLRILTVDDIQKAVENYYKISHSDLVSKKRSRNIAFARHVAIYLCRKLLDQPFEAIASKFNRDHSTAMYSVTKIERASMENREVYEQVESLKRIIRES